MLLMQFPQLCAKMAKMENTLACSQNAREGALLESNSEKSVTKLSISFKNLQAGENCIEDLDGRSTYGGGCRIPSLVVSLDGKYVRRWLELIRVRALKAASSKVYMNVSSGVLDGYTNPAEFKGDRTFDNARFVLEDDKTVTCYSFMNSPGYLSIEEPSRGNYKFMPSSDWSSIDSATLQCKWKCGVPRFVFTVNGQKEVYVANLSKVGSADGEVLDYVYLFYLRKDTRKYRAESHLVGKMKVSSSVSLCPNNSRIVETHFVLYCNNEWRTNEELCAIVVKDRLSDGRREEDGGWGLKFLKNDEIKQTDGVMDTSMDIIVPAGVHGGSKTQNDGPSGLVERWRSGGCCDCGGWDIGCPITVLNAQPSKETALHGAYGEGKCKDFDMIVKASEESSPALRMTTIHDGLYSIHFQPVFSALQAFSTAVAFMHDRSPAKMYRI